MRPETVATVLEALGSYHYVPKLNSAGTWGAASCALAPWTHGGGRDRNPSLMVSVEPGPSAAKCMSCGFSSGMLGLVNEVHRYGGINDDTLEELRYLILLEETRHYAMLEKEGLRPEIPQSYIHNLDTWHPYWEDRGFTKQEARHWRLGYDPEGKRALIPFFDFDGILRGVVGRDITGWSGAKYKVMPEGFDRAEYLYGEHRITGAEKRILLVEGYLDAISASRYVDSDTGVVALGTAIPSNEQVRRLGMIADEEVIIGLDNDKTGQLGIAKLQRMLTGSVMLSTITYGDHKDANEAGEKLKDILAARHDPAFGDLDDVLLDIGSRPPTLAPFSGG